MTRWVRDGHGIVHIHARFADSALGSVTRCHATLLGVRNADFIKEPSGTDRQCIRCQENDWRGK